MKTAGIDAGLHIGVGTVSAWNDHGNIGRFEQRQIIGGISQGENPRVRDPLPSFQSRKSPPLADALSQKVRHSVALHNCELTIDGESPQPGA